MATLTVTQRIKQIQSRLGLEPDGIVGAATVSAIERLLPADNRPSQYNLICSKTGLNQLVQYEISSDAYYNRFLKNPTWPGGASGITIGVGYDLGYNSAAQIKKDWQGKIADKDLDKLLKVAKLKADDAKRALNKVKTVAIPLEVAREVFYTSTLHRYAVNTRSAYPGVEKLPADAQSALLSLIFNRGTSMSGNRRKEMKAIQPLVKAKDLLGIAEQIRAMKRLWAGRNLDGLLKRRDQEAQLVANAQRDYQEEELMFL